jgi:hypothetical protein
MPVSAGVGRDFLSPLHAVYGFMSQLRRRQFFGVAALMVVCGVAELRSIRMTARHFRVHGQHPPAAPVT